MKQAERLAHKEQKEGPAQKMNRALNQGDFKNAEQQAEMLALARPLARIRSRFTRLTAPMTRRKNTPACSNQSVGRIDRT